jgi:hypothetical protein
VGRLETLSQLSAALSADPRPDTDWTAVVNMANEALVTPQLHAALAAGGRLGRVPPAARAFLAEVLRRNRERNRRLFTQLRDAVASLNAVGIEPVLLKGAALWLSLGRPDPFDRMFNDLDLLVRPEEAERAAAGLVAAGFARIGQAAETWHGIAEFGRPADVGLIDLHWRPPGPLRRAQRLHGGRRVDWEGVHALAPEAAEQIYMLALHDQFHEGAYWRGDLCLRHLLDISALAPLADGTALRRLAAEGLARRGVAVQLEAARRFARAQSPWLGAPTLPVRLHHLRRLIQFGWPVTIWPLACLAALSEAAGLIGRARTVGDGPGRPWSRLARFSALVRPGVPAGP